LSVQKSDFRTERSSKIAINEPVKYQIGACTVTAFVIL